MDGLEECHTEWSYLEGEDQIQNDFAPVYSCFMDIYKYLLKIKGVHKRKTFKNTINLCPICSCAFIYLLNDYTIWLNLPSVSMAEFSNKS